MNVRALPVMKAYAKMAGTVSHASVIKDGTVSHDSLLILKQECMKSLCKHAINIVCLHSDLCTLEACYVLVIKYNKKPLDYCGPESGERTPISSELHGVTDSQNWPMMTSSTLRSEIVPIMVGEGFLHLLRSTTPTQCKTSAVSLC